MSKYIDLTDRIGEGAEYSNTTSFCLGIECALRWLDAHPGQAPGPTITESSLAKQVGNPAVDAFAAGFANGFRRAGGQIVPDPEPTNAEKLHALYMEWKSAGPMALDFAEWMDIRGVKAPGGDDEH